MTRPLFSALAIVLLAATAAPAAAQTVQDFQLPPPTPTPTATAQGPIDPDNPVAQRPRVITTPTPTPTRTSPQVTNPTRLPTPTPTPTPSRARAITLPQPSPAARATARPDPVEEPRETAAPATESAQPAAGETDGATGPLDGFTAPTPVPGTDAAPRPNAEPGEGGIAWWMAVLALLVAAGVGFALLRRRGGRAHTQPTEIERPRVDRPTTGSQSAPVPAPAAAPPRPTAPLSATAPRHRVELAADALRVVRSFANITLAYRFEIANRGGAPVEGLRITGDLVSAHGGAPVDEQLAEPSATLPLLHEIATLAPGEVRECKGEIRLPLQAVRPIWQGKAPLMVPLVRLVLSGEGIAPYAHTLVVGRRPAGNASGGAARLQPFRLDEQAQTYRDVGARALG